MIFRAAIVALITLSQVVGSGVIAQTLVEPNPKPKLSQPPGSAKQQSGLRTKSCSAFGAGTDTCVKVDHGKHGQSRPLMQAAHILISA